MTTQRTSLIHNHTYKFWLRKDEGPMELEGKALTGKYDYASDQFRDVLTGDRNRTTLIPCEWVLNAEEVVH